MEPRGEAEELVNRWHKYYNAMYRTPKIICEAAAYNETLEMVRALR